MATLVVPGHSTGLGRALAESEPPPMRLVLGHDALKLAEVDLNQQLEDLMDWESVSFSTDFAPTEA